jgi:hypothetical protein
MTTEQSVMDPQPYFSSTVYTIKKPEFLDVVKTVSMEFLEKRKKDSPDLNELYPVYMTEHMGNDPRLAEFANMLAGTGWNILQSQGYEMESFNTYLTELWCQEHYKHSGMEQHTHNGPTQLIGFYFLDTPEDCSMPAIHDPRAGKVQSSLPEKDMAIPSLASNTLYFKPEPGMLFFTNAWLPHTFTRHGSKEPIRFLHFGIGTQYVAPAQAPAPVIV